MGAADGDTGLYTDESPGLKVDPVVVLVLSLVFIFSVVALHSECPVVCAASVRRGLTGPTCSHRQDHATLLQLDADRWWRRRTDVPALPRLRMVPLHGAWGRGSPVRDSSGCCGTERDRDRKAVAFGRCSTGLSLRREFDALYLVYNNTKADNKIYQTLPFPSSQLSTSTTLGECSPGKTGRT